MAISFYVGLKASYDALTTKSDDALYFITDTLQIYKGEYEYTKSAELVSGLPTTGQRQGVVYVDLTDFGLYIWNGSDWVQINKSYATSIDAYADDTSVPTSAAVAEYVTNKIADVTGGTGIFVTDVSYADGVLSVAKGEEPIGTVMTGLVNNPTYEAETRTITLPVYGGDTLTIALGKDAFVESGSYNEEDETLDLVLTSGDEVIIPVSALIALYTGMATQSAQVTVGADNSISVEVNLSATANNAITLNEDGLYVDLSNYYNKTEVDEAIGAVSDKVDAHIADTDIHVTAEEKAEWDAKASADDVASAIATALETAAEDAQTKADAALADAKTYADEQDQELDDRLTVVESALTWQTLEIG